MAEIGKLVYKINGDTRDFDTAIRRSGASARRFGGVLKQTGGGAGKLGGALNSLSGGPVKSLLGGLKKLTIGVAAAGAAMATAAAYGIFRIGKASVKAASEAEETQNKFEVVFRGISSQADAAATSIAEGFGLTQTAAKGLLSDTSDLLQGFGVAKDVSLELSTGVQALSADLASFTNYSGGAKGASEALTKALLGERESVKSLGIAITDAELKRFAEDQGLIYNEMTKGEKAILTYNLAIRQSQNAIGDFARSRDSFANQMRIAKSNIDDLKESIGNALIPIVTNIVNVFNDDLVPVIQKAIEEFTAFLKTDEGKEYIKLTLENVINGFDQIQATIRFTIGRLVAFSESTAWKRIDNTMKSVLSTQVLDKYRGRLDLVNQMLEDNKDLLGRELTPARRAGFERERDQLEQNIRLEEEYGKTIKDTRRAIEEEASTSPRAIKEKELNDTLKLIEELKAKTAEAGEGDQLSLADMLGLPPPDDVKDSRAYYKGIQEQLDEAIAQLPVLEEKAERLREEHAALLEPPEISDYLMFGDGVSLDFPTATDTKPTITATEIDVTDDADEEAKAFLDSQRAAAGKLADIWLTPYDDIIYGQGEASAQRLALENEYINDVHDINRDFDAWLIENQDASQQEILANLEKSLEAKLIAEEDYHKAVKELEEREAEERKERTLNAVNAIANATIDVFGAIGQIQSNNADQYIQDQRAMIAAAKKRGEDTTKMEKSLAKEKRKLAREEAIRAKSYATFEAIINAALAITSIWASHAKNPIYAGILTATTAIATALQIAAIQSQPIPAATEGLIVPGAQYAGDRVLARVNSGEMILNAEQQAELFDIAKGERGEEEEPKTAVMTLDGEVLTRWIQDRIDTRAIVVPQGSLA